jgi:hypothetical protein
MLTSDGLKRGAWPRWSLRREGCGLPDPDPDPAPCTARHGNHDLGQRARGHWLAEAPAKSCGECAGRARLPAARSSSSACCHQHRGAAVAHALEARQAWKIAGLVQGRSRVRDLSRSCCSRSGCVAASVLAAMKLPRALGTPGVTPRQFLVIALQMWLPTAVTFVLVINVALDKWELCSLHRHSDAAAGTAGPGVIIAGCAAAASRPACCKVCGGSSLMRKGCCPRH